MLSHGTIAKAALVGGVTDMLQSLQPTNCRLVTAGETQPQRRPSADGDRGLRRLTGAVAHAKYVTSGNKGPRRRALGCSSAEQTFIDSPLERAAGRGYCPKGDCLEFNSQCWIDQIGCTVGRTGNAKYFRFGWSRRRNLHRCARRMWFAVDTMITRPLTILSRPHRQEPFIGQVVPAAWDGVARRCHPLMPPCRTPRVCRET